MLEPRSRHDFRDAPSRAFVAGASWFYFSVDAALFGYAIWGRPSAYDIGDLVQVLELELDRPPHDALVDLGGLAAVVPEAFEALASYTIQNQATLARIVTRTAIVRPPGVNGAIVSGFFDVSARPFPVTFWGTAVEALRHLDRGDADACAAALSAARARVSREPSLLRDVRTYLAGSLRMPEVGGAARALGVSARTLQRRLSEHGTSFQAEVTTARIEAARRLLRETSTPVTTIAYDLGFATPQHFATLFRRCTSVSPSVYRDQGRGDP